MQPQWVFDCVNYRKLLSVEDFFTGVELPPHLSPFVQEQEGDYIPPERQAMLEENEKAESAKEKEDEKGKSSKGLSCRLLAVPLEAVYERQRGCAENKDLENENLRQKKKHIKQQIRKHVIHVI